MANARHRVIGDNHIDPDFGCQHAIKAIEQRAARSGQCAMADISHQFRRRPPSRNRMDRLENLGNRDPLGLKNLRRVTIWSPARP
jgi:hypothetical protein